MIDKNKQYRTQSGHDVRIYATDGSSAFPIHGAINIGDEWIQECWKEDGKTSSTMRLTATDLVEVKTRHKRTFWLNIPYVDGTTIGEFYSNKRMADRTPYRRVACVRVELDFVEGEGLD